MSRSGDVRVGMIGCGGIACAVHLPTLIRVPGVAVVGVADPSPLARAAAQRIAVRARAFDSAAALLDAGGLDAVVLAMPSPLHAPTAVLALDAGYHVYVEKPVATTARDALSLLDAWVRSERIGVAGFNYRQHPLVQQTRRLLQAGAIGEVVALQTVFSSPASALPEWKQQDDSGGALFDRGAHHVDLAAFLLGAHPVSVTARQSSRRSVGDTATLECVFPNDATMQSVFSFDGVAEDRITVIGQTGRLSFDRLAGVTVERSHGAADRALFRRARSVLGAMAREPFARTRLVRVDAEPSFRYALNLFVESVRRWPAALPPDVPTLDDGVRSLEVLLAAREAAASGTRVMVQRIAERVSPAGET